MGIRLSQAFKQGELALIVIYPRKGWLGAWTDV